MLRAFFGPREANIVINHFLGVEFQPLSSGSLFGNTATQDVRPPVEDHEALDGRYDELWANGDHRRTIGDAVELITKSPWHSGMPLWGALRR